MNLTELSPSTVKKAVELCMRARVVPFIVGSPGCGKSQIVKEIADEYGLKMIDCRLSTMEPTDLQGLPWIQDGKAQFNPYEFFPLEDTPIPKGYQGWCLFLDEFNSASRATQAAAYRVVLDREVGQHKLHSHCFVIAAGNKLTDNAIVNRLSTAMISRVVHLPMIADFDDWLLNFAIPHKIDERIIAYLSMYPDKLMQFDPEREDEVFCSPRTWEFASKLIRANEGKLSKGLIPVLSGCITFEEATSFVQFSEVYKDLITIDMLQKNPDMEPPQDHATLWATVIHLINATTKDNFKDLVVFLRKIPSTFQIVYLRSLKSLHRDLLDEPEFVKFVEEIGDFCFGE